VVAVAVEPLLLVQLVMHQEMAAMELHQAFLGSQLLMLVEEEVLDLIETQGLGELGAAEMGQAIQAQGLVKPVRPHLQTQAVAVAVAELIVRGILALQAEQAVQVS
jgi:hypothetical protein